MKQIKTNTADIDLIQEEIVRIKYFDHVEEEDVTVVKENVEAALELGKTRNASLLVTPPKYSIISVEARKYLEDIVHEFPFVAVIFHNLSQRIIGNFMMKIGQKGKINTFDSEEKAVLWLNNRIEENGIGTA